MLPILSLFGLALASIFLPDSQTDSDDEPNEERGYVSDQKTASQSFDTATMADTDILDTRSDTNDTQAGAFLSEASDNDQMIGSTADDELWGLDGDDSMWGSTGNDTLFGGAGDDVLYGDDDSEGDDLIGGDGHDTIYAGQFDRVSLGAGDDVLKAVNGAAVHVDDFNPDDDRIEVLYEKGTEPPTLSIVKTETGINLVADDSVVAILDGVSSLNVADVALIAA